MLRGAAPRKWLKTLLLKTVQALCRSVSVSQDRLLIQYSLTKNIGTATDCMGEATHFIICKITYSL